MFSVFPLRIVAAWSWRRQYRSTYKGRKLGTMGDVYTADEHWEGCLGVRGRGDNLGCWVFQRASTLLLCFFFCIMAQKSDTDDVGQPEHYYSYPAVSRDASFTHYQHGQPRLLCEAWSVVADVIRTPNRYMYTILMTLTVRVSR